jgi:uncharacterized protein (TIGR00297 family)
LVAAVDGKLYPFLWAFVGALAAAAADTAESEIGVLGRRLPRRITDWRTVEAGTDGAVSWLGTLSGLAAALAVTLAAAAFQWLPLSASLVLALTALAATLAESLIGATLERQGRLGNDAVNFLNTLIAAVLGGIVAVAWSV